MINGLMIAVQSLRIVRHVVVDQRETFMSHGQARMRGREMFLIDLQGCLVGRDRFGVLALIVFDQSDLMVETCPFELLDGGLEENFVDLLGGGEVPQSNQEIGQPRPSCLSLGLFSDALGETSELRIVIVGQGQLHFSERFALVVLLLARTDAKDRVHREEHFFLGVLVETHSVESSERGRGDRGIDLHREENAHAVRIPLHRLPSEVQRDIAVLRRGEEVIEGDQSPFALLQSLEITRRETLTSVDEKRRTRTGELLPMQAFELPMEILNEEAHRDDRVHFFVPQRSIEQRIQTAVTGVPPDRRSTLVLPFESVDLLQLVVVVRVQGSTMPRELSNELLGVFDLQQDLLQDLSVHERRVQLIEIRRRDDADGDRVLIALLSDAFQRLTDRKDPGEDTGDLRPLARPALVHSQILTEDVDGVHLG